MKNLSILTETDISQSDIFHKPTNPIMDEIDENQNFTNRKGEIAKDLSSILSHHEDLRRATLLKHRKVSTQLKLDMVQRQLTTLRRSGDSDSDRQFYRSQVAELSSELQDLGSTLDKAERNAFYAKKRLMRHCGISLDSTLSSSNPSLWTSAEDLRGSRSSLKARVRHLVSSSPTGKFKKRNFFGELRAAASLSSLNMKSGSPTSDDSNSDPPSSKNTNKLWKKSPLRFLGHLVDSRFRRSFWRGKSPTQRTKSADNILEDTKEDNKNDKDIGLEVEEEEEAEVFSSSSSSESEEEEDWRTVKVVPRYAVRGPVLRKISSHQKAQVDPAVLAEIEDFERMAENYIKQHS